METTCRWSGINLEPTQCAQDRDSEGSLQCQRLYWHETSVILGKDQQLSTPP